MKLKLMLAASAAVLATACGSNPETTPTPSAPTPAPAPSANPQDALREAAGSDRVYYGFDQSSLTAEARQVLRAQADFLKENPALRVRIEGNCDERGTREYNLALGARRANAAKDFLVGLGVDPSRVTTISYGKDRPIDPRSNEAAWAKNRNARTFITGGSLS